MKIHRFIGKIEDPEITKQIRNVLKLKPGEQVILSDGMGHDTLLEITAVAKKIEYKTLKNLEPVKPTRRVSLYLAILKKENFEWAVQKTVEAGVCRIIPVITERTIKTGLNFARLEKIMLEASEQSGRSVVPVLSPTMNFKDALKDGENAEEKIIFHLHHDLYTPDKDSQNISIFVGPEGGFTDKEITLAKGAGYTVASLGQLTLRGETAALIATYRVAKGI